MARHAFDNAFRRVRVMHFTRDDGVEADDFFASYGNISLRRIRLLGTKCVPDQEAVEFRLPACERLNDMGTTQLFDTKRIFHGSLFASKTDGS